MSQPIALDAAGIAAANDILTDACSSFAWMSSGFWVMTTEQIVTAYLTAALPVEPAPAGGTPERVMALLQQALALAPEAGLRLEMKVLPADSTHTPKEAP